MVPSGTRNPPRGASDTAAGFKRRPRWPANTSRALREGPAPAGAPARSSAGCGLDREPGPSLRARSRGARLLPRLPRETPRSATGSRHDRGSHRRHWRLARQEPDPARIQCAEADRWPDCAEADRWPDFGGVGRGTDRRDRLSAPAVCGPEGGAACLRIFRPSGTSLPLGDGRTGRSSNRSPP
jgi:hypothetical protein